MSLSKSLWELTRTCLNCNNLFFKKNYYLFIWLCWVFISVRGLPPVAASGGHSSSRCAGLSSSRPLLLRSTGSRRAGSVIVAHGPSCSAACGILPDQGSNPCPLHKQADSQPLRHQGSPTHLFLFFKNHKAAWLNWDRWLALTSICFIWKETKKHLSWGLQECNLNKSIKIKMRHVSWDFWV